MNDFYKMRGSRTIMKGRFQNGNIAYIYADELELFAAVYRKDKPLTDTELELCELLNREGPMTIHVMKEFTGMLTKEITPACRRNSSYSKIRRTANGIAPGIRSNLSFPM